MEVDDEAHVTLPLVTQLAKERLRDFQCNWILKRSGRTPGGPCKILLNSWHSLRQHILAAHCQWGETECKLSGCNLVIKTMQDTAELREHILTGHLNNLKLPCPIRGCDDTYRETRLGIHFRSDHDGFLDQPFSQLRGELQSIHPYKPEHTPPTPLPSEFIPVFTTHDLLLHPHRQHIQLPKEEESSESEVDEEILQLALGVEDCHIEFQKKLAVTEAEFLSMPFDSNGRIPSTQWPLEKSIGYEAFAQKMEKLHPKPKKLVEPLQQHGEDQLQTQPTTESLALISSGSFSTGQYARKTGVPAHGGSHTTRVRVSKTV